MSQYILHPFEFSIHNSMVHVQGNMSDREYLLYEIKKYLDKRITGLEKALKSNNSGTERKREKDFQYKSNQKHFFFNEELQETLENVIQLIEKGARHRALRKLKECVEDIKRRNKLIRIADESPGEWDAALSNKKRRTSSSAENASATLPPNRHLPPVWR